MSLAAIAWAPEAATGSIGEKAVLMYLCIAANERRGHIAWPSISTIARVCSCSRTTAIKHIKSLIRRGLISRIEGSGILGRVAQYRVHCTATTAPASAPQGGTVSGLGGTVSEPQGGTVSGPKRKSIKEKGKKLLSKTDLVAVDNFIEDEVEGSTEPSPKSAPPPNEINAKAKAPKPPPNKPKTNVRPIKPSEPLEDRPHTLPDWMPADSWNDLLVARIRRGLPSSTRALEILTAEIDTCRSQGYAVELICDELIRGGWKGVKPHYLEPKQRAKSMIETLNAAPIVTDGNGNMAMDPTGANFFAFMGTPAPKGRVVNS